jgi:NADH-quinone oxidoreductase subunit N
MNAMNWNVVLPEIWLLVMACVVTLADPFVQDAERRPTFWLTYLAIAVFAGLHLWAFDSGVTAYGMQGLMVVDPMGHLLAFLPPWR